MRGLIYEADKSATEVHIVINEKCNHPLRRFDLRDSYLNWTFWNESAEIRRFQMPQQLICRRVERALRSEEIGFTWLEGKIVNQMEAKKWASWIKQNFEIVSRNKSRLTIVHYCNAITWHCSNIVRQSARCDTADVSFLSRFVCNSFCYIFENDSAS